MPQIIAAVFVCTLIGLFFGSGQNSSDCGPDGCPTSPADVPKLTMAQQQLLDHGAQLARDALTEATELLRAELKLQAEYRTADQAAQLNAEAQARQAMLDVFLERNDSAEAARRQERTAELAVVERLQTLSLAALGQQLERSEQARQLERTAREQAWLVLALANPVLVAATGLFLLGAAWFLVLRAHRSGFSQGAFAAQLLQQVILKELSAAGASKGLIRSCPSLQL